MEAADLMREAVTLRRMAKPLAEVPPMQEAVTLRVLQWPLTEVVVHQDGADGCAIDRADGGDRREGGGDATAKVQRCSNAADARGSDASSAAVATVRSGVASRRS